MPLVDSSSFRPPWWLMNAHAQTLWPALFRRVPTSHWRRERLELPDGDFLDLDWSSATSGPSPASRIAIVSHGLEGHSRRAYMAGLVRTLNRAGWDAVAWNFRGCSGESNRSVRAYHSGSSDDLAAVVNHVTQSAGPLAEIALAGFSLGGNVTLKYLAELGSNTGQIRGAVVFSVPCDLASASACMARPATRWYLRNFLKSLRQKAADKVQRFPEEIPARFSQTRWESLQTFEEFDGCFTAPVHGFRDAADYYAQCSAKPRLHQIQVPTLILNATNDPFLSPACFPRAEAAANPKLWLETPSDGGHVGFRGSGDREEYWHERRAVEFLGP